MVNNNSLVGYAKKEPVHSYAAARYGIPPHPVSSLVSLPFASTNKMGITIVYDCLFSFREFNYHLGAGVSVSSG